ncbi:hypothetical protein CF319_g8991, partial [Tilletia indica]
MASPSIIDRPSQTIKQTWPTKRQSTRSKMQASPAPSAKRQATSTTAEGPETNSGLTMGSTHAHFVTVINSYNHSTTTTAELVQAGTQALLAELEEAKTGIAAEK